MRLTLIRLTDREYQFVWTHHHLLLDGWSMFLLLKEVFGQNSIPARPYRDYIERLQREDLAPAETFWRDELRGFTRPTPVLNDRGTDQPHSETVLYRKHEFRLPAAATAELNAALRKRRVTINTVVHGVWALILSHWAKQDDVVLGTIFGGRPMDLPGNESMIGMFISAVPVRVRIAPDQPVLDWLENVQVRLLELNLRQLTPLLTIQRCSELPAGTPLFASMISMFLNVSFEEAVGQFGMRDVQMVDWNSFPLCILVEPGSELSVLIKYDSQRFDASTVLRAAEHFKTLLNAIARNSDRHLIDLLAMLENVDREHDAAFLSASKQSNREKLRQIRKK
jgi:hypothetical protein